MRARHDHTTRPRARHRWARRAFLRLEVAALVLVAVCIAALSASSQPERIHIQLTGGGGGSLTLSNTKEGAAILSLGGMRPGDSVTDTVTLGNTGTLPGDLSLDTSNLVDTPGSGGGTLSGELDLRVRDITNVGSPVTVYTGKIAALTPVALGTLVAGNSRVYEFKVDFPDTGAGAENAYQGSGMSVEFDWTAVNNDADTVPPETTILTGPSDPTNDNTPSFTYDSTEAGSSFECKLDGPGLTTGSFSSCPVAGKDYSTLADGTYTFSVQATDAAGNTDPTPATRTFTVDTAAPETTILTGPSDPTNDNTPSFTYDSTEAGSSFECKLDGPGLTTGSFSSCPVAGKDYSTLADGTYTFSVQATDAAGNTDATPASRSWTLLKDVQAPSKPGGFKGSNSGGRLVLKWTAATDNGAVGAYLIYANGKLAKTLGASARSADMGAYTTKDTRYFQVAARDAAGNVGPKTKALVIVPSLRKLTLAQAKSRLTARGLKSGTVSYAYSSTVPSGRVISAARSGLVVKGAAVGLKVSRGVYRSATYVPVPPETTGFGGTSSPTPSISGGTFGPGAPTSGSSAGPTFGTGGSGPGTDTPPPAGSAGVETANPQSFSPGENDGASGLRRLIGLGLLGGAFATAGALALRKRSRLMRPSAALLGADEPLLFWDQRFARATAATLRRFAGRI